ncbi:unnamed protein product [Trichobilharzia regenti]|nr:unnamed protein product [Trichobilharzia regenti]
MVSPIEDRQRSVLDKEGNQSDVVNSIDELHRVGTFVHIPEWDDLGSKIRLLVIGHRRIELVRAVDEKAVEETNNFPGEYEVEFSYQIDVNITG